MGAGFSHFFASFERATTKFLENFSHDFFLPAQSWAFVPSSQSFAIGCKNFRLRRNWFFPIFQFPESQMEAVLRRNIIHVSFPDSPEVSFTTREKVLCGIRSENWFSVNFPLGVRKTKEFLIPLCLRTVVRSIFWLLWLCALLEGDTLTRRGNAATTLCLFSHRSDFSWFLGFHFLPAFNENMIGIFAIGLQHFDASRVESLLLHPICRWFSSTDTDPLSCMGKLFHTFDIRVSIEWSQATTNLRYHMRPELSPPPQSLINWRTLLANNNKNRPDREKTFSIPGGFGRGERKQKDPAGARKKEKFLSRGV